MPGEEGDRRPQTDEQHRYTAVPDVVRAEAERDHGDPVADRRDRDRARERAEVGVADRH